MNERAERHRQEALDLIGRIEAEPRFKWEAVAEFVESLKEKAERGEGMTYKQVNALWRIVERLD